MNDHESYMNSSSVHQCFSLTFKSVWESWHGCSIYLFLYIIGFFALMYTFPSFAHAVSKNCTITFLFSLKPKEDIILSTL